MARSTKESWLTGPGDLKEDDVQDVPVPGESVRVRGLSARYSAEVQGKLKLTQEGREQVAKIDVPEMELTQFVHGVIDPVFTEAEARQVQEKLASCAALSITWARVMTPVPASVVTGEVTGGLTTGDGGGMTTAFGGGGGVGTTTTAGAGATAGASGVGTGGVPAVRKSQTIRPSPKPTPTADAE